MPTSSLRVNPLVQLLGDKKIWINWTLEPAKNSDDTPKLLPSGAPKYTKIPRRVSGTFASVSDPSSWSTYQEAISAKKEFGFSGVGIVFEESSSLVGVDLDHYLNAKGEITDVNVLEFLIQSQTYTEKSPSGTGLHVFFQTNCPFDPIIKKNKIDSEKAIEIYSSGRYFTFTEDVFSLEEVGILPATVRKVTIEEINKLLSLLGYPWGHVEASLAIPEPIPLKQDNTFNDDSSLLERMFSAKNGVQVRALYDGDISQYNDDHSSADMALVSHLAFWSGRNPEMMRRIWLASPLGNRTKTQTRKDYVERTIDNAIKNCLEVYTPKILQDSEQPEIEFLMTRGKNPAPELILENICRVLEQDPRLANRFRLNDFSHMTECWDTRDKKWMNLLDRFVDWATREISTFYPAFSRVSVDMVKNAIRSVAAEHPVNPPVDWLRSLKWDETPRLAHWLYKVYGTPDDDLHQAMGSNFLKGMVDRILNPGCQMDLVLCLEGAQGTKKSSSLRALAREWFAENVTSVDTKDDMILFAGNILVEFSEGAILNKASVAKLKSVITTTTDKFRPPYEHGLETFPRGCVFSMSTNDTAYLKDETGGRRFLIVKLNKIADVDWLKENRTQLFAEAVYRLEVLKEKTYEFSDESAESLRELQQSRTQGSAYDEIVVDWYLGRSSSVQEAGVTPLDVYNDVITKGDHEMGKQMEITICNIFRRELRLENKQMKKDESGKRPRRWVPTDETRKMFSLNNEVSVDGIDEFDSYVKESESGD